VPLPTDAGQCSGLPLAATDRPIPIQHPGTRSPDSSGIPGGAARGPGAVRGLGRLLLAAGDEREHADEQESALNDGHEKCIGTAPLT
jgi:hypothetical protein